VNNSRALEADPAMEVASKEELIDALESPETMRSAFDNAAKQAVNDAELEFLGGIAILSRGREIDEQLARYDLLGQMAGHEHYRLNVADTGSPARINLTIVRNAGNAGTVSLEVNTTDYRIKADLSLTIFETAAPGETPARIGRIDGRISTDSVRELREAERPLTGFMAAMENEGYDTSHITSGADSIGEEQYRSRLGELLRRAEADTESIERLRNRDNVSTDRLYRVARSFLSFFL